MIDFKFIFIIVSFLLLFPILMKIRHLLTGQIHPADFFKKGEFFNIELEKCLAFFGIISLLLFFFFSWYETPVLKNLK